MLVRRGSAGLHEHQSLAVWCARGFEPDATQIEGIEVTLAHLRSKRDRAQRIGPIAPVTLPMPVVRDSPATDERPSSAP
jgi:hypothetical protein